MIFTSDNWAGAHPAIADALNRNAGGFAAAYGASELDRKVERSFNDIFGQEVAVFFVGTGTAANSIALASASRPGGVAFCHSHAHIMEDECGAPEFFSGGTRLAPVHGPSGKMNPEALINTIARYPADFIHHGQPVAISLTQATESGTVYTRPEIRTISNIAHDNGLVMHMDGARFANALVALDLTPREMTVESGVDILSFGGTKNGCWCAEALVVFNPEKAKQIPYLRKRGAQLFSKSRFIAAQFAGYFENGLWLELAHHSNAMADLLRQGLAASNRARLAWDSQANELFIILPHETTARLRENGAKFYDWPIPVDCPVVPNADEGLFRLVTSFATTRDDVERFVDFLD